MAAAVVTTAVVTTEIAAEVTVHQSSPLRTLNWPGYGRAPAETMELFLAGLAAEYGSAYDYARDLLGIDRSVVDALRARLLEG